MAEPAANRRGGFRPGAGRKRMDNDLIADKTRKKRILVEKRKMQRKNWWLVRDAFVKLVKDQLGENAARVVKLAVASEESATEICDAIDNEKQVEPICTETACGMQLHLRFGKEQYKNLAMITNKAAKFRTFPNYDEVRLHKVHLRPSCGIRSTDTKSEVNLQSLLSHTLQRIVQVASDDMDKKLANVSGTIACTMTCSYGYDAATGQRRYKQRYVQADYNSSDASLFAVVMNPLILEDSNGVCLWKNLIPQSRLFVRPILHEYAKETEQYIEKIQTNLDNEIAALVPIQVKTKAGHNLDISPNLLLTMIDGKVFNHLTKTGPKECPTCGCNQKQMNDITNVGTVVFRPKPEGLKHGIQPLHAWIKFFTNLYNVAVNKPVHEQKATGTRAKELRDRQKKKLQKAFLKIGLRIGFPNQFGFGTSVDGNTARRAFRDPKALAKIFDISEELVRRYWIILCCVNNTFYKLRPKEFSDYCQKTFELYKQQCGWFPISPSVHKVLFHSVEIQQRLNLPHGVLSEGAGETVHGRRKDIRKLSTRKDRRDHTNTDMMNRLLDESDPVVSTWYALQKNLFKKHEQSRAALLPEARRLLIIDDEPGSSQAGSSGGGANIVPHRLSRKRKTPGAGITASHESSIETRRVTRSQLATRPSTEQPVAGPSNQQPLAGSPDHRNEQDNSDDETSSDEEVLDDCVESDYEYEYGKVIA